MLEYFRTVKKGNSSRMEKKDNDKRLDPDITNADPEFTDTNADSDQENEYISPEEDKFKIEETPKEDESNIEASPEENEFKIEEPYNFFEEKRLPNKKSSIKILLFDLVFYAFLIFVCIYILPNYVIQRTIVDGSSMENTLMNGEHLYVEKISYHFNQLDRFDIIVFYPYGRENKDYYVKRIIGMPGETVQIIGSDIYINGKVLKEHYGKDPIDDPGRAAEPIKLGNDEYFVMGDNRNISKDSRDPSVGNVKKSNIGGKVFFRISPLKRLGPID